MYLYLVGFICMIVFTLYYFNYDPFYKEEKEKENENEENIEPIDISYIENSINELKSLNEYINNGTAHRASLP